MSAVALAISCSAYHALPQLCNPNCTLICRHRLIASVKGRNYPGLVFVANKVDAHVVG